MIRRRYLYFLLLFCLISSFSHGEKTGNFSITDSVVFAGTEIKPGLYSVEVVEEPDGAVIRILKGDTVLQEDRAIVIPALTTTEKTGVETGVVAGGRYLRLRIRSGANWYYAYMEISK